MSEEPLLIKECHIRSLQAAVNRSPIMTWNKWKILSLDTYVIVNREMSIMQRITVKTSPIAEKLVSSIIK